MKYYTIRNQADDEGSAEVLLYGDIGEGFFTEGIGAKQFAEDLKALGPIKNLSIRINSPGGSVFEGLALFNTLERHPAKKTVTVDGLAASIASLVCMCGDVIRMPQNALMMVHDPFALVMGNAKDMEKMAETLVKIKGCLISAYTKKSGLSDKEVSDLMSDETWMTANEAVEWGFADEVAEPMRMAASMNFDLSAYKKAPKNLFSKKGKNDMDEHEKFEKRNESEKTRTREISTIGKQFNLQEEALSAIQDGISLEEFRIFAMAELQKKIVPIGPLDPRERASYGSLARETGRQSGPFRSFGDQMISIYNAGIPGGRIDQRLNILNATGLGTAIPSEGGWLIQTDFSTALLDRMNKTAVLAPKCWHVPIGANADGLEMPTIDETSRATGSRWGGVQVYRRAEADTVTAKKPKFGSFELRLEDLMGLCYTTNRQLKDAPSTGTIISRAFEEEFSFVLDNEIVRGTGVGECLGILNSAALVTVLKETNQPADTVLIENITKMFSRMPARYRKNAFWAINQEIETQLFTMGLVIGMGGSPVFLPGGSISGEPYGSLFARPIIPIEQASALGDVGDILFLNLDQYCIIEKDGMEATQSIHVRFVYDESCFKFIVRNNGAPLWKKALTPYKGANDLSPFVTLESR